MRADLPMRRPLLFFHAATSISAPATMAVATASIVIIQQFPGHFLQRCRLGISGIVVVFATAIERAPGVSFR
jgi:hypothetical protein